MTVFRSDATAICVLGMHRGGTSAVTGVLHELGAYLGPAAHLMAPREDNPAGFHEHQLLTDLNDELLHALGGSWFEPPALDPGWERAPHLDGLRVRAQQRLHDDFADVPTWAWKDPRTCLTLPFWRPLLPRTRFVVCVRNPLDVARSLRVRDGLDEHAGVDLWMRHMLGALAGHVTTPLLVLYDAVVNDPAAEVARIAGYLDLHTTPEAMARARAHLDDNTGLRHHHATLAESCAAPAVSFAAVALYAALQRSVALQQAGALRVEDLLDVSDALAGRAARAHADERESARWPSRLATLAARAAELEAALAVRDADVERAQADVAALTSRLDAATSDYARLEQLRLEHEAAAAAQLGARDAELAALRTAHERDVVVLRTAHETDVAGLRTAYEADVATIRAAHEAELSALRTGHEAGLAVLRTAHDEDVAAVRTAHDSEVTALRTAHDTDTAAARAGHAAATAALRAAHDIDVAEVRAAHDHEVAALRTGHERDLTATRAAGEAAVAALVQRHDADLGALRAAHESDAAGWQARAAADAATRAMLDAAVQRAHAELSAAGTEQDRLNALLLYLQTPTGLAKLGLRAVLPAGLHRRLRRLAMRAPGGRSEP